MTLLDYLRMLRRRWLWIGACAVIGILAALVITMVSPKSYTATTTSFVTTSVTGAEATGNSIYAGSQFASAQTQSYVLLVSSPLVLDPVIKDLGLDLTLAQLRGMVTATSPQNSVIIHVTVTDANPELAAKIANATAKQLGGVIEATAAPHVDGNSLVTVTLTQPALTPAKPSSPRPTLNLALGLIAGLAAGVVLAVVRHRLDTSISSADDLQETAGVKPLGIVELIKDVDKHPLVAADATSRHAEAFRVIRSSLQFVDVDNPPSAIAVTSAMPSEGKTLTSCNLAIAMAQAGRSVCVVDADLRMPKVAERFGIDESVGLTNVLAGQRDLDDALVAWRRGLLTVLPAGTRPSDPSAVLASTAMSNVLLELHKRFDVVILDVPPLLPVTDAAIVAHLADGALLVARHRRTTREQLRHALEALSAADARLLGTVLTCVSGRRSFAGAYAYGFTADGRTDSEVDNTVDIVRQTADGDAVKPKSIKRAGRA